MAMWQICIWSEHCKATAETNGLYHPVIETNHHNQISNPERLETLKALNEAKTLALKTELKPRTKIHSMLIWQEHTTLLNWSEESEAWKLFNIKWYWYSYRIIRSH